MKIVPLFFACMALLNFAKIGARCDDGGAGRGREGPPERRRTILPNPNRVLRFLAHHPHNHPTETQNTGVNHLGIHIKRVLSGHLAVWHLLEGDLVPDSNITSCNGPHGYAIVDLVDRERLYACIRANMFHRESIDREMIGDIPVFLATVLRSDRPELEADLAPRNARSRLNSEGLLYYGENAIRMLGTQSVGHVRYVKSDPINPIDIDGDLYHFPEPEPRT